LQAIYENSQYLQILTAEYFTLTKKVELWQSHYRERHWVTLNLLRIPKGERNDILEAEIRKFIQTERQVLFVIVLASAL